MTTPTDEISFSLPLVVAIATTLATIAVTHWWISCGRSQSCNRHRSRRPRSPLASWVHADPQKTWVQMRENTITQPFRRKPQPASPKNPAREDRASLLGVAVRATFASRMGGIRGMSVNAISETLSKAAAKKSYLTPSQDGRTLARRSMECFRHDIHNASIRKPFISLEAQ